MTEDVFRERRRYPRIELKLNAKYKVLDYEQVSEDTFRCKYKPMVELALLEIKTAATAPKWTKAMRKERIAEILDMAGF